MKKLFSIMFLLAFSLSSFVSLAGANVDNNDFLEEKELIQDVDYSNDVLIVMESEGDLYDNAHYYSPTFEPITIDFKGVNLQTEKNCSYRLRYVMSYRNKLLKHPLFSRINKVQAKGYHEDYLKYTVAVTQDSLIPPLIHRNYSYRSN
jgi:uncharacterized protein with von Willebrand factor type A (vWA) domain